MSYLTYFAADKPLVERPNPFVETLSINEALKLGIELDLELLAEIDRDEPEVILFCEDEAKMSYPNIYHFEADDYLDELGTTKPFTVGVDHGELTTEDLGALADYARHALQDHLQIELWSVWLGSGDGVANVQRSAVIGEVTAQRLAEFFEDPAENKCLTITR